MVFDWKASNGGRCQRFDPQNHPQWRIVRIFNRPPHLSAFSQLELTVRTINRPRRKKPYAKKKTAENVNLSLKWIKKKVAKNIKKLEFSPTFSQTRTMIGLKIAENNLKIWQTICYPI